MAEVSTRPMVEKEGTERRERTASGGSLTEQKSKLAEHVNHRPQKEDLIHKNIIKDYTPSVDPRLHGAMRSLQQHQTEDKLSQKLARRQSWQKLVSQGVLLEQPLKHSPQVVLATQALRKQHDRDKLARLLSTRPSLDEIKAVNLDDTMTWERFTTQGSAPSSRNCHTMTAIGNNLYLLGGYGTNSRTMELTVLETSSQRCWTRAEVGGNLPLERYSHTCCKVDGKLVVFGGFSFNGYRLNDLHVLDTDRPAQFYSEENATSSSMFMWEQPEVKGTPPCARAAFTATTVDKKIYFFGGNDGQNLFNDLFVLDTETWTWSECPTTGEVPTPRAGHTANLVNANTIVVFGGGDVDGPSNHIYIFDVDTLEWTQPKIYGTPPSVRMGHTATTVNTNQFIVFGGNYMDKVFNDLHMFDIETMQWSRPSDTGAVPLPRAGHSACSIGCQVFFFGGGDSDDLFADLHVLDTSYLMQDRSKQDASTERKSVSAPSNESDWAEEEQEAQAFKVKAEVSSAHIKDALKSAREQLSKAQTELSAKTRNVAAAVLALEQSNALNFEQLNQYVTKVEAVVSRELEDIKHGFEHYRSLTGNRTRRLPLAPPAPTVEPRGILDASETRIRSPSDDVARQVKVALRRPAERYQELKKVPEGTESPLAKSALLTTPSTPAPLSPTVSAQHPTSLASFSSCSSPSTSAISTPSNLITPKLIFAPSNPLSISGTSPVPLSSSSSASSASLRSPKLSSTSLNSPKFSSTSLNSPKLTSFTTSTNTNTTATATNAALASALTTTTTATNAASTATNAASTATNAASTASTASTATIASPATNVGAAHLTVTTQTTATTPPTPPPTISTASVRTSTPLTINSSSANAFPSPITISSPTLSSYHVPNNTPAVSSSFLASSSASPRSSYSSSAATSCPLYSPSSSPMLVSSANLLGASLPRSPFLTPKSPAVPTPSSPPTFRNSGTIPSITVTKGTSSSSQAETTESGARRGSGSSNYTPKGSPAKSGSGNSSPNNSCRGLKGTSAKISNWGKNASSTAKSASSVNRSESTGRSRSCSKGDASAPSTSTSGRRGSCSTTATSSSSSTAPSSSSSSSSAASTRLLWKQKEQETQSLKHQLRNRPPLAPQQASNGSGTSGINNPRMSDSSSSSVNDQRLPMYSGIDPQVYPDPLDQLGPQGLLESFRKMHEEEEAYVDADASRLPVEVVPLTPEQYYHIQQKQAHLASLLDRQGYNQSFNRPTILSALISSSAPTSSSQSNPVMHRRNSGGPTDLVNSAVAPQQTTAQP